jgi:hypothetical protein
MKKIKIIADDRIPFLRGVLDEAAEVVYLAGAKTTPGDVRDADAVFLDINGVRGECRRVDRRFSRVNR